jgi:hypothetical protein
MNISFDKLGKNKTLLHAIYSPINDIANVCLTIITLLQYVG